MIALSIFIAILFAIIGLYGSFHLLSPLYDRIPNLNSTIKRILSFSSPFIILLIAILSVCHLASSYTSEMADFFYEKGLSDGSNTDIDDDSDDLYADGYDDGYLDGYNDGHDSAYESINALIAAYSVQDTPAKIVTETESPSTVKTPTEINPPAQEKEPVTEVTTEEIVSPAVSGTVYFTESGEVYHKSKDCSYLKKSKNILTGDISEVSNRRACSRCVK